MSGHEDWVTSAGFTGGAGSSVVTSSEDGTVRVWDAVFQPELEELARLPGPVTAIEVPDGGRVRAATIRWAAVRSSIRKPERELERRAGADGSGRGAWSAPTAWSRRFAADTVVRSPRTGARRLSEATVTASPQSRSRGSGDTPRHGEPSTTTQSFGTSQAESRSACSAAQHRSSRCAVEPGRALGRHGGEASEACGTRRTGRTSSDCKGTRARSLRPRSIRMADTIVTGGEDGTVRTYGCQLCGRLDELVELAERRLAATRRELTPGERERYLG